MASLDELDRPSPIEEMLTTVAQIVMPKKEYATFKTSTKPADANYATQNRIDDALGRPRLSNADIDTFYTGGTSRPQESWDAAIADFRNDINYHILQSGKTRAEWESTSGLTSEEFSRVTTIDSMIDMQNAKYPPRSTPDTGTGGTGSTAGTTGTTGTAGGSQNVNPVTGKPETRPGEKTPEQELADAEARVKQLKEELANNPSAGQKRFQNWQKWAKRGTGTAVVAAVIIAALYAKALAILIASNGAEINFNTIKTKPVTALGFNVPFVTPDEVDITWTARKVGSPGGILSAVRTPPGCGITFHGSDLPNVERHTDGVAPTEIEDPKKKFSVNTETGDSSGINRSNQGWGKISTNFDQALNQAASEGVPGLPPLPDPSAFPGLPNGLPSAKSFINGIIAIILIVVVFTIMGPIIMKLFENFKSSR